MKSLLRFRSVCKNWRNIIDDHSFANMHSASAAFNFSDDVEPQVLTPLGPSKTMHSLTYDDIDNVIKQSERPILDFSKIEENYIVYCVAYGLICFQNLDHQEKVYLCNPLRREILELPKPSLYSGWVRFGIGFDHTINTYKIIRVTAREAFNGDLYDKFEVYALGSNSWREVSPPLPFYHHLFNNWGVSAYGDIHWLLYLGSSRWMIISFDFSKEKFNRTPLYFVEVYNMINLRGSLAIFGRASHSHFDCDLFVTKDHRKREWVRVYRIFTTQVCRPFAGASGDSLFFFGGSSSNCVLVLNLKTNGISWNRLFPKKYDEEQPETREPRAFSLRNASFTRSVLSLRNFGNLFEDMSGPRSEFLKSGYRVYVSPSTKLTNQEDDGLIYY